MRLVGKACSFEIQITSSKTLYFSYSAQYNRGEDNVSPGIFPLWQHDPVSPSAAALQRH